MKITNALLLMCAVVIGLVAQKVLADEMSRRCPGSVTWNAADVSQLGCPSTCEAGGNGGVCVPVSTTSTVNVWNYDATLGKWVQTQVGNPPQPLTYSGTIVECKCKVNTGTDENPVYVFYANPCCIIWQIPAFDGNTTHMAGISGTCPTPTCPSGTCQGSGNNNVATAVCE